jgi:hypothetical protein
MKTFQDNIGAKVKSDGATRPPPCPHDTVLNELNRQISLTVYNTAF